MRGIPTTAELHPWNFVELDQCDTFHGRAGLIELPENCQRGNLGATSSLRPSIQNGFMTPVEADSNPLVLAAGVPTQSSTDGRSKNPNTIMQISSPTNIHTPTTYSFHEETAFEGQDFSRKRSQTTSPSYSSFNFNSSISRGRNTASLVNDLAQTVHFVDSGWKISFDDKLYRPDIDAYFATPSPVSSGIKALKECSCGPIPKTLKETFPLLRIAFAAACLLHHEDQWFPWHRFFEDVYRWSAIIQNSGEKELYLKAVDALQSSYNESKDNHSHKKCVCSTWVTSSPSRPREMIHEPPCRSLLIDEQPAIVQPPVPLGQGLALSVCIEYLDRR